jgi:ribonuclease BN (tRNA processing enzyme)
MQIRVLGCSGSIAAGNRTTSFLLDDDVLIDAGTGVGDLSLDELARIDQILLSHSHLDHVLAVGLLADSVARRRSAMGRPPIGVHALPQTLEALSRHLFNGILWPDFTRLPDPQHPVLRFEPIAIGQVLAFGARRVEVLPAVHTVPAVGYAVHDADAPEAGAWVYSGDTGPNPALWSRLASMRVHSLVIETAFGDDELELARISRHLCPSLLRDELAQLKQPAQIYITHIKPGELEAVMAEIGAQGGAHQVRALSAGQRMAVGGA